MINVTFPTPLQIVKCWSEIKPFVDEVVKYSNNEFTSDTVLEQMKRFELFPIVVYDDSEIISFATLEKITFETGKTVINIQLASGTRLEEWRDSVITVANNLAKANGCEDVYIIGRKGWVRNLKQQGFEEVHTVLAKKVV